MSIKLKSILLSDKYIWRSFLFTEEWACIHKFFYLYKENFPNEAIWATLTKNYRTKHELIQWPEHYFLTSTRVFI